MGAARGLWRLLHPSGQLQSLFRESTLVPNAQSHDLPGYPRFTYGGYSFLLVDPWPEYWADNWYATDDVYIAYDDYDNGYYLYNRRYPAIRLAISVAL